MFSPLMSMDKSKYTQILESEVPIIDQHSVRLCNDVFSIIVSKVLEQKKLSSYPSFDRASKVVETNYKARAQDQLSSNWNAIIMKDSYTPAQPLYIYKANDDKKNSTKFATLAIEENKNNCSATLTIPLNNNSGNSTNNFCFDGPNEDNMLLINHNSSNSRSEYSNSYMIPIARILEESQSKPHLDYSKTSLLGHQRHCIALASKKMYTIASSVRNAYRHWLSWFTYDQTRRTTCINQSGLQESLKKIAFLINSTLVALNTNGLLCLYWVDKNNKLQRAVQKIPYNVMDFAVDPIQKGFIVLALQNKGIQLACADIWHKNALGQILFQWIEGTTYPDQLTNGRLTYYNNTICHGENPEHWQKPYSMFQIFPKTRLKKALCSKSN